MRARRGFESVVILDSGKTDFRYHRSTVQFESVVILDSGKTPEAAEMYGVSFESVVILDSGKTGLFLFGFGR